MNIMGGLKHLGLHWQKVFLDTIFPNKCQVCNIVFDTLLCSSCLLNKFKLLGTCINMKSEKGSELRNLYICYEKSNLLFSIIKKGKYNGMSKNFCRLTKHISFINIKPGLNVIPIPLHKRRFCERGYNQSRIIADILCGKLGVTILEFFLIRNKYTKQQATLLKDSRCENIRNSFSCKKIKKIPEQILLVDDIYTTGSTMNECAKVLKLSGVKYVDGFVLMKQDLE